MPEAPARVINNGRVTIPADMRRELDIEKGDYVMIDVRPIDGGVADD
jgi:AbrB family looped-hinge helix DNA binding protein